MNDYLQAIDVLKTNSKLISAMCYGKDREATMELYACELLEGKIEFWLFLDEKNNYKNCVKHRFWSVSSAVVPLCWTIDTVNNVVDIFFNGKISCEVYSVRYYGEPPLKKPKALKGLPMNFSVEFIQGRCRCQCFAAGEDLWIKHRDFFSPIMKTKDEDMGTPLSVKVKKYLGKDSKENLIYANTWGSIVKRNEAWIVFRNIRPSASRDGILSGAVLAKAFLDSEFAEEQGFSELSNEWRRFLDGVCEGYKAYLKSPSVVESTVCMDSV